MQTESIRAKDLTPDRYLMVDGGGFFRVTQCGAVPKTGGRVVWIALDNGVTGQVEANETLVVIH